MKERVILHCDLNNFFASVALLKNQTLLREPVAVCGSVEDRHGIVLAKNEIAKSYGVKTAQVVWEAKTKCPDLIILKPDYKEYKKYSDMARSIYERYTDKIEPFGIDECWLDVSGSKYLFGNGENIANRIRKEIKSELGITISVGVSFNKVFAKLGSDMKKPDAVTVITKDNFKQKVWSLPIGDLLYAGKKTVEKLNSRGVFTVGDITACDDKMLKKILGIGGVQLKRNALGLDDSQVTPYTDAYKPKSVGRSVTPKSDILSREDVWKTFISLSEDICKTLRSKKLFATGICIHIRKPSLEVKETSRSFLGATNCSITLAKKAMELFDETYGFEFPMRSVGFRAINLKEIDNIAVQTDIFGNYFDEEKDEVIEKSIFTVREKYGDKYLKRCRNL